MSRTIGPFGCFRRPFYDGRLPIGSTARTTLQSIPLRRDGAASIGVQGVTRMGKRILITGGAGFIGSHLADELLRLGHRVRALDNLTEQVHGRPARRPEHLAGDVELVVGDVRDGEAVRRALRGVDAVFHLAAMVGVGQSMYQLERYASVNTLGTAVLLEALIERPVERLVVASSMSLYGEGLYQDPDGRPTAAPERAMEDLRRRRWELSDGRGRP